MIVTDTFTRLRPVRARDAHGHQQPVFPDDGPEYDGHASPYQPPGAEIERGQEAQTWLIVLGPEADVKDGDRLLSGAGRLYTVDSAEHRPAARPGGFTAHLRVLARRVVEGATTP